MLRKCRDSVLTRDLRHVSLCGVSDMMTQALSHFIIYFVFILVLLQRAQCSHCKRCISYGNSVRLSVRPSHAGIVSKRW